MIYDLQKASVLKRISAFILDLILLATMAVGVGGLLSVILGYDAHSTALEESYAKYESQYGIVFDITAEQYAAMAEEELASYNAAYAALIADEDAMYSYNMVISQSLLIVSLGIFVAYLILEFLVPLYFGNGQTLGKKVFSIALMRVDGVRLTPVALFVRTVLGKYTIETMIPVLLVLMIAFGSLGMTGTLVIGLIGAAQIVLLVVTRNNSLIHDLLAGTVAVDMSSQMIFQSTEDLIAYKKRIHAEKVARTDY